MPRFWEEKDGMQISFLPPHLHPPTRQTVMFTFEAMLGLAGGFSLLPPPPPPPPPPLQMPLVEAAAAGRLVRESTLGLGNGLASGLEDGLWTTTGRTTSSKLQYARPPTPHPVLPCHPHWKCGCPRLLRSLRDCPPPSSLHFWRGTAVSRSVSFPFKRISEIIVS